MMKYAVVIIATDSEGKYLKDESGEIYMVEARPLSPELWDTMKLMGTVRSEYDLIARAAADRPGMLDAFEFGSQHLDSETAKMLRDMTEFFIEAKKTPQDLVSVVMTRLAEKNPNNRVTLKYFEKRARMSIDNTIGQIRGEVEVETVE